MDKKISISQLKEVAQEAYEQVKGNTGGKNADYIPYLANIDKNLFGISICLMNGQTINIGDTDYRFGIESVSKVHTAILILRQYGAQKVLDMIGADATGLPFNSIIAILLENDHPHLQHQFVRIIHPAVAGKIFENRHGYLLLSELAIHL